MGIATAVTTPTAAPAGTGNEPATTGSEIAQEETPLQTFIRFKENRTFDYGVLPAINASPVYVDISMNVIHISDLRESSMDFTMDVYFRQEWNDERLAFGTVIPNTDHIGVPDVYYSDIWLPDTYLENGKDGKQHDITMDNKMFRVYQDGNITYSQRLSLVVWCNMDLRRFPLDNQTCKLNLKSYRYVSSEVTLRWRLVDPVYLENSGMLSWEIKHVETKSCNVGHFSCIRAILRFSRLMDYYVIQVYAPSILLVSLSWVSFWLHPESVPARVSLGLLLVLASAGQLSGVASAALPKVSYLISMDVWVVACLAFLCASVLEFALANTLARAHPSQATKRKRVASEIVCTRFTKADSDIPGNDNAVSVPAVEFNQEKCPSDDPIQKALFVDRVSRVAFP